MRSFHLKEFDWGFVCDGSLRSGLGHVVRSLGFAEILQELSRKPIFLGDFSPAAVFLIEGAGFDYGLIDMSRPTEQIREANINAFCVDSYELCDNLVAEFANEMTGQRSVVIDDFASRKRYESRSIVNFTILAETRDYGMTQAQLFLGPSYFPARRWLRKVKPMMQEKINRDIKNILVLPGGNDFSGVTQLYLEALKCISTDFNVRVRLNEGAHDVNGLRKVLNGFNSALLQPLHPDLSDDFLWADACLSGGGLSKYECCFAGLPVCSLAQTQEQQEDSLGLAKNNLIWDFGLARESSVVGLRNNMIEFLENSDERLFRADAGLAMVGASGEEVAAPFLSTSKLV